MKTTRTVEKITRRDKAEHDHRNRFINIRKKWTPSRQAKQVDRETESGVTWSQPHRAR